MKYDEAFPDTWYIILVVALCALVTWMVPELSEFLPNLLGA